MALIDTKTVTTGFPYRGKLNKATLQLDTSDPNPDFEMTAVGRFRTLMVRESTQVEQDAEIIKRVEALPPVADQAARLALPFGTGTNQVQLGDEVFQLDTQSWFKFNGTSAADITDNTKWVEIGAASVEQWQTVSITSDEQSVFTITAIGSSDPFVTLNGQEIAVTLNATKDTLTIVDTDVIAVIETSDLLRVRG